MKLSTLSASILPGEIARQDAFSAMPTAPLVLRIEARNVEGIVGMGEALLEGEFSGENVRSALDFVERFQTQWLHTLGDIGALRDWVGANAQAIDWNPGAWMAVELALLDLLAKQEGIGLEKLLGARPAALPPHCTAVIGEVTPQQFDGRLIYFICAGHQDYKIALSGIPDVDRTRIEALEAGCIAPDHVRAGARRLWLSASRATRYLSQLQYPFWAVEEPLAPGALREMRRLGEALDMCIVLDESVHRAAQLDALAQDPNRWVLTIRLGKMGGLLRTLALTTRARRLALPLILAAPPGERPSGLRALLCLGAQVRDIALAQEGGVGAPDAFTLRTPLSSADELARQRATAWLLRPGLGVDPAQ